ncbi:MAG: amino acid ABC transporter substrate-binding protein, partial [Clostridia bacterium]|nr:amino acid ABC transporter substrate-binding protein [Clostridia bacterium]
MKKFLALLLAGLFLTAFLVGCAPSDEDILVMATNAEFPPYEYKEGEEFKGIDVELAEAIAAKLGKKLVIEDVPFGSIVSGVNTGKYDIGMAGLTVTDERKLEVNFSKSYATGVQVVIVKENSAIKSLDDLAGANVMIGV